MQLTLFAPIFALLLIWACFGARQWLAATLVASLFQGATPVLVTAGGRLSGIAPAYALLCVGGLYWIALIVRSMKTSSSSDSPKSGADTSLWWLAAFTAIAVTGAYLLPRIFAHSIQVMPPRWGLDTFMTAGLKPSSGNIIQGFYCVCNFALFYFTSCLVRYRVVELPFAINSLAAAAALSAAIGVYQVISFYVGLPWPDTVINSNLGVGQPFTQTVMGFKRMSATFYEPSMLALHFLGLFALLAIGLGRRLMGFVILVCLLASTSKSAYAGLLALAFVWIWIHRDRFNPTQIALVCLAGAVIVGALFWAVNAEHAPLFIRTSLMSDDLSNQSEQARGFANKLAFDTLVQSWGLGVGLGSTRASSLIAGLAATVGIPGLIAITGFLASLLLHAARAADRETRAFAWGLLALLLGWAISVPDLAIPLPWLFAGLAHGSLSRSAAHDPSTRIPGEGSWQTVSS